MGYLVANIGFYADQEIVDSQTGDVVAVERSFYFGDPDETQFDLHADTFDESMFEILSLWTDFCRENHLVNVAVAYVNVEVRNEEGKSGS